MTRTVGTSFFRVERLSSLITQVLSRVHPKQKTIAKHPTWKDLLKRPEFSRLQTATCSGRSRTSGLTHRTGRLDAFGLQIPASSLASSVLSLLPGPSLRSTSRRKAKSLFTRTSDQLGRQSIGRPCQTNEIAVACCQATLAAPHVSGGRDS
jgi:hypothetical protein